MTPNDPVQPGAPATATALPLTDEQRAIIEAPDGPVVVIAGAGTGKTRVIVERVRWLLETKGQTSTASDGTSRLVAAEPAPRHGNPFDGPLAPEQLLVLTYNVKAARELQERLDGTVGPSVRARMSVSNFHSFCQHVLTESASDADLPPSPEVLDGVGQLLLLLGLRARLGLVYHGDWAFGGFVSFINRAKDELVTPDGFDIFVAAEQAEFERRFGSFGDAHERLAAQGNLAPIRAVRSAYAGVRSKERSEAAGRTVRPYRSDEAERKAEQEARRAVIGTGTLLPRNRLTPDQLDQIDALADTYVRDGAALEVVQFTELSAVYRAYEAALAERGALDFGEQIALVTKVFKTRPNVLRRWQRQYRYLLVDEFQDANVAQIELIELLGRTPDRPDNVMVVGDDDQSIYRFRGASFAAFAEFDTRFSRPPTHDSQGRAPGTPRRLRLDQNFRSTGHVLTTANRLIHQNSTRYEPDKRLRTDKPDGHPVDLHLCAGEQDEAVAIVDTIKALAGPGAARENGRAARGRWSDVAVLYRMHRHRDAIVERLRSEGIPYTVVGGLSLFETPEIRDLEQGLRAITDPHDDAALVRMMTAGPWRLDALEVLRVTRDARFDRSHIVDAAKRIVAQGELHQDEVDGQGSGAGHAEVKIAKAAPETRAKLRALLAAIEELNPQVWRDGPFTVLERYVELTGQVLDLLAVGTLESRRKVVNLASLMRFAADWQTANPTRSLADFMDYLDAYKTAGGELPTNVELSEDAEGVRLMTLYQAKGLEFPVVIVPHLLEGDWPAKEQGGGWFPAELLREQVPTGDLHMDEERRLLYVAMTRAQERLILTTHAPGREKAQSSFVAELQDGAGADLTLMDRTAVESDEEVALEGGLDEVDDLGATAAGDDGAAGMRAALAATRKVLPLPSAGERRLELRLRATELVTLLEATAATDPEAEDARVAYLARLEAVGRSAAMTADEARAAGLDPLTFRSVAADPGAGAGLLAVAPLPRGFSYSSLSTYEACPLRYALAYVYRVPEPDRPAAPLAFGSTAHTAFEAFTRERRERAARGEPAPTRADLQRLFSANWVPQAFGDKVTEEGFARRVDNLLGNFWDAELASTAEVLHEELPFEIVIAPEDGTPPVRVHGSIDRVDRLPSGGIEVLDYKTGKMTSQKDVSENLQLTIYALACRDALRLGTPERVTLYFTESATRMSTTRTDEQLDAARQELLARATRIRSGDFAATPGKPCEWCAYRALCPERV